MKAGSQLSMGSSDIRIANADAMVLFGDKQLLQHDFAE